MLVKTFLHIIQNQRMIFFFFLIFLVKTSNKFLIPAKVIEQRHYIDAHSSVPIFMFHLMR